MGGFACTGPSGLSEGEPRRIRFTDNGVKFFMKYEPDLIPDLPLTSITDRSKSSSFGKALLIVQAFWFILNVHSRATERLPCTLLELSTLVRGLYAMISYMVWWSKPLNIDEPTWISMENERAREAYALLIITRGNSALFNNLRNAIRNHSPPRAGSPVLRAAYNAAVRFGITSEELLTIRSTFEFSNPIRLDSGPPISEIFSIITLRVGTLDFSRLRSLVTVLFYLFLICVPFNYGLYHYLVVSPNGQFPSTVEQELWHVASVVVMSSGFVFAVFKLIFEESQHRLHSTSLKKIISRSYYIINYYILALLYTISSGYLLFESIRQLWYLPRDAYVVASWLNYIPHLF